MGTDRGVKYRITLTGKQLEVIADALAYFSRLGIGDLSTAVIEPVARYGNSALTKGSKFSDGSSFTHTDVISRIYDIKRLLWRLDPDENLGIHNRNVPEHWKNLFNLHRVMRDTLGGSDSSLISNGVESFDCARMTDLEVLAYELENDKK